VPRKKINEIPTLARTINVCVPMLLEDDVRDACKKYDFSTSRFVALPRADRTVWAHSDASRPRSC